MSKFTSFGLKPNTERAIQYLGFKKPTEIQMKVIPLVLQGQDVIACAKTGTGKTAAYLIPLIDVLEKKTEVFGARALIIVPTRELALQTSSVLKKLIRGTNLTHSIVVGGHTYEGQFESLTSNPDIVIATPGRLVEILKQTDFTLKRIQALVLDEADKLFEAGYREQLDEIIEMVGRQRQTIMLSATIPDVLTDFARAGMREYVFAKIESEYTLNQNLEMHMLLVKTEEKVALLSYILTNLVKGQVIVFVSTRYWVDYLQIVLPTVFKINASYLYGKMDNENRIEQLDAFRNKATNVLIVTDLIARGIDIPNVETIINFDYPSNDKIFIHRCGRSARAGKSGRAFTFLSPGEMAYMYGIEKKSRREVSNGGAVGAVDNTYIYFGTVNNDIFNEMEAAVRRQHKLDEDYDKLYTVAVNSMKKFNKTRSPATVDDVNRAKSQNAIQPHFMFKMGLDSTRQDFMTKLHDFKPKASLYELKMLHGHPEEEKLRGSLEKIKALEGKFRYETYMKKKTANAAANNDLVEVEFDDKNKYRSSMFIEYDENPDKVNELLNQNKITHNDVDTILIGDEHNELFKYQKRVWDVKRKTYKKYLFNEKNERIDDSGYSANDKKRREDKLKKRFSYWKKVNSVKVQKEGTALDSEMAYKSKKMFNERKRQNFKVNTPKMATKNIGKQLRTREQIFKSKKQKERLGKINMSRNKKQGIKKRKGNK